MNRLPVHRRVPLVSTNYHLRTDDLRPQEETLSAIESPAVPSLGPEANQHPIVLP